MTAILAGGVQLKEPAQPWPFGAAVLQPNCKFLRALVLLPDPDHATQDEGVKEVWAKTRVSELHQAYPGEINTFEIAVEGKQQGYLRGLARYLSVRRQAGQA